MKPIQSLIFGWTFFTLLVLFACKSSPRSTDQTFSFPSDIYVLAEPIDEVLISAHRGGIGYPGYPENCLETFDYLASFNPLIIECDVAASADGTLLLMHDNTLERTTNGSGVVNRKSWSELSNLNLEDDSGKLTSYKIPTLDKVLKWSKGKAFLTLDIKNSVRYESVIKAIHDNDALDRAAMIAYSVGAAEKMHRLEPRMMISLNIRNEDELRRAKKANLDIDKIIAFTGTRRKKVGFYDMMEREGISTIFGTLGNIDKQAASRGDKVYQEFLDQGIDIIATDRPLEVAEFIYD